jgi:hypothetical protein
MGLVNPSAPAESNLIERIALTLGSAPYVEFTDIPEDTFEDLRITFAVRLTAALPSELLNVRFNGDSGANYSCEVAHWFGNAGAVAQNFGQTSSFVATANAGSAPIGNYTRGQIILPGAYRASRKAGFTDWSSDLGNGANDKGRGVYGFTWNNVDGITSIRLFPATGEIESGSSFSLYGDR